jgi:hypothetical protein
VTCPGHSVAPCPSPCQKDVPRTGKRPPARETVLRNGSLPARFNSSGTASSRSPPRRERACGREVGLQEASGARIPRARGRKEAPLPAGRDGRARPAISPRAPVLAAGGSHESPGMCYTLRAFPDRHPGSRTRAKMPHSQAGEGRLKPFR